MRSTRARHACINSLRPQSSDQTQAARTSAADEPPRAAAVLAQPRLLVFAVHELPGTSGNGERQPDPPGTRGGSQAAGCGPSRQERERRLDRGPETNREQRHHHARSSVTCRLGESFAVRRAPTTFMPCLRPTCKRCSRAHPRKGPAQAGSRKTRREVRRVGGSELAHGRRGAAGPGGGQALGGCGANGPLVVPSTIIIPA